MDADELNNKIFDAFKLVVRPKTIVSGSSLEASYVYDYFHDKKNTEIDELFREYKYDASALIHFLSGDAFVYYLPGFMSLLLYKYEDTDVFFDAFISKLINRDSYWFSLLNKEQRLVVGLFLMFILEKYKDDFFDDEIKDIADAIAEFAR